MEANVNVKDPRPKNINVHPAVSSILEKALHNVPWPGQTEVIVTRIKKKCNGYHAIDTETNKCVDCGIDWELLRIL